MDIDIKQQWRTQQRRSLWLTFWIVLFWVAGFALRLLNLLPANWTAALFVALALGSIIAIVVALFKNSRCPVCAAYIRDHDPKLCPHCGVELR